MKSHATSLVRYGDAISLLYEAAKRNRSTQVQPRNAHFKPGLILEIRMHHLDHQ